MRVTHLHYLDFAAALQDLQTGNWGSSALYGNNAFVVKSRRRPRVRSLQTLCQRSANGDPGRSPTCDLRLRSAPLYASELPGHAGLV